MKGVWQLLLIVCERKSHGKRGRSFLYKENFSEVMFPFQREREGRDLGLTALHKGSDFQDGRRKCVIFIQKNL